MRNILPIAFVMLLLTAGCSSIDCPLNNTVYMKMVLNDGSGLLQDTLSIGTVRHDGTDTLLVNRLVGAGATWIPMSYDGAEDQILLLRCDTLGNYTLDTLRVAKTNLPHFESVDCSPSYFHEITNVSTTHYGIDSAVISKTTVDYDTTKTHITVYFKADI